MDILGFFDQHPVFTHSEFTQFLISQGSLNANTHRESLAYHLKKGHIVQIRRGYFASLPMSEWGSLNYPIDSFLIAGRITPDAVIGYHSALDFYGLSYSMYNQLSFMSQQKVRPFTYQSRFICLPFPKTLCDKNQTHIEVQKIDRHGLDIYVTSIERTIVDLLDRPNYAGGWEEIWQSAAHFPILKLNKMIKYAFFLQNATTIAKLGFFLEQHKELFSVDENTLNILQERIPTHIHYIERNKRQSGKLIKRWNLVVPTAIIERIWEEPNNDSV